MYAIANVYIRLYNIMHLFSRLKLISQLAITENKRIQMYRETTLSIRFRTAVMANSVVSGASERCEAVAGA